jgi:hypothetical protein
MHCRVGRTQSPAVSPTRFLAQRDTVPAPGAAALSCPAVPETTIEYTAPKQKALCTVTEVTELSFRRKEHN